MVFSLSPCSLFCAVARRRAVSHRSLSVASAVCSIAISVIEVLFCVVGYLGEKRVSSGVPFIVNYCHSYDVVSCGLVPRRSAPFRVIPVVLFSLRCSCHSLSILLIILNRHSRRMLPTVERGFSVCTGVPGRESLAKKRGTRSAANAPPSLAISPSVRVIPDARLRVASGSCKHFKQYSPCGLPSQILSYQQFFEKRSVTFTIEHVAALIRHSFDSIVEISSVEWRNKGNNCLRSDGYCQSSGELATRTRLVLTFFRFISRRKSLYLG
jgi:hypothetical protein